MSLRVAVTGEAKPHEGRSRSESEPDEGVLVGGGRRETKRSTHVQDEVRVTPDGGPHQ